MGRTVGIDLGTTNSCIAYVNDAEVAEVIFNREGKNTTPSVVYFESTDNVVVGQIAKDTAVLEPKSTISFVKRLMGKTDFAMTYGGKDYSPEMISSLILKKLVQDAENSLGEEIKDVVITCPAYFGTQEKEATRAAGEIAGLNVLSIIPEPTAAAIAYGVDKGDVNKTIMVYDLGGGTFDVTVMRVEEENGKKVIRTIATGGDHELGGKDWDKEIMDFVEEEFRAQNNFEDEFDEDTALQFEQDLRGRAENAKIQLSGRRSVGIPVVANGMKARVDLALEKFEELTETLLERTIDEVERALESAKEKGISHIDEIILVGGSSRMPQVEKILNKKYPDIPRRLYDADEAVAKGAAIFAHEIGEVPVPTPLRIGGGSDVIPEPTLEIINVTSKSYGVEFVHDDNSLYVGNLIFKDQEVPADVTVNASTCANNQKSVAVKVYESDIVEKEYDINEFYYIGEAVLELDSPKPAGYPVLVNLKLEADGTLHVTGKDGVTGESATIELKAQIMTKQEIEEQKTEIGGIRVNADE